MGSNVLVFCAELASALHLERLVPTISSDRHNGVLEVVPASSGRPVPKATFGNIEMRRRGNIL
jgi:hypothetical protein